MASNNKGTFKDFKNLNKSQTEGNENAGNQQRSEDNADAVIGNEGNGSGTTNESAQNDPSSNNNDTRNSSVPDVVKDLPETRSAPGVTTTPPSDKFKAVHKFETAMVEYLTHMHKDIVMNKEEGGKRQYGLWLTLLDCLNSKSQEDFNNAWNTILRFSFNHKEEVFNEKFIYRFPEYWTGSDKAFSNFRRIIYLMINSNDVKTRKSNLERINLEKTCEDLNEKQKNYVINFYQK